MEYCNNSERKKLWSLLAVISIISSVVLLGNCYGQDSATKPARRNDLLEKGVFIQIPGPNPILVAGPNGSWDDRALEAADGFKDFGTYYLYYHGLGGDSRFRIGVATSENPLGPFVKYKDNPILESGPSGSWDDTYAACPMILKEGLDKYYMWYWGQGSRPTEQARRFAKDGIGLATASNPLGPWKKYEGNPVLDDFGFVGGVVKVNGKYYMYSEYPIDSRGPDYGPMALATADKPEGPWKKYEGNPILEPGEWGEWDDGGFSEAEVIYHSGVFHMFYGGSKLYAPRIATRESIGYAYSYDGFNFKKYGLNPVATRYANPNASAFAEVHAIFEAPFIYLYHTLRYVDSWRAGNKERKAPGAEDLGVQILVTQRPFSIDMPVLNLETLAAGKTTALNETAPVCLNNIEGLTITAQCKYDKNAKKPIRLHIVSSTDGLVYDTTDLYTFNNDFKAGQTVRKTVELKPHVKFIKIMVENLDKSQAVSDIKIIATLTG